MTSPPSVRSAGAGRLLPILFWAAIISGFVVRLASLTESLWLDEFATLWTVEAGLSGTIERAPDVMYVSPFYFVFAWGSVNAFGESEWALRLPSLVAVGGAAGGLAMAAMLLGGRRAAAWSALLFWWCYPAIWASVDARPYAFGLLFGAVHLWGWIGACLGGTRRHRALWIVGTAGLAWSHYVFIPFALAAPASYWLWPPLRRRYRAGALARDAGLAALLCLPLLPHLLTVAAGRADRDWRLDSGHLGLVMLLVPFALAMVFPSGRPRQPEDEQSILKYLRLAIAVQWLALEGGTLLGADLVVNRYAYLVVLPAAILAGSTLSRLARLDLVAPLAAYAVATGVALAGTYQIAGSLSGAGFQEWREAVGTLRASSVETDGVPVLFRSGNYQDDLVRPGTMASPFTLAPLRGPGNAVPDWNVLLLTYRWNRPGRAAYFEDELRARLDREPVFYLICLMSEETGADGYCPRVESWVEATWPGRVSRQRLGPFRQVIVTRFDRR